MGKQRTLQRNRKRDELTAKQYEYNMLYLKYKLLALDIFQWNNLPNGIESRYIEQFLYEYGQVFIYEDEDYGLICLPCFTNSRYNIYGEPLSVRLISNNGEVFKEVKTEEGVLIKNNDLGTGNDIFIRYYVDKLNDVQNLINVNLNQQRFPFLITSDQNSEMRMKLLFEQFIGDKPLIIAGKEINNETIQVLQTNAPYLIDRLSEYKAEVENELLSHLGLNNVKHNKKERLLVDEVNSNNDSVDRNCDILFKNRARAVELINEKFNLNIEVVKKNDIYNSLSLSKYGETINGGDYNEMG